MDYQKAEELRKKSFGSLLGEQEGGLGASLKSAISQKTQARMTGIKEKFDPMNIARALAGKTGAAIYGKIFGRDQKSMERFAGARKKRVSAVDDIGQTPGDSSPAEVLGLIYRLMLRNDEDEKIQDKLNQSKEEERDKEEEDRNQQLIRALTGRKKEPTRKEKKAERRAKRKEEKKVETKAKEAKPEIKPKVEKAPEVKPKVEKAPSVTKPPSIVDKLPGKSKILGSLAIAGTAALVGKEALATNIAKYESGKAGYNAYNKGTVGNKMIPSDKPIDFSKMTITEFLRRGELKKDDPDRLFAVGRYQIIPPTMKDLIKQMKIDPDTTYLDAATQDSLFTNGLVGQRRKKVDSYVKGKSDDRDGAILELAKEFASVGVPYDMEVGNKKLKKGDSYYSGIGGNKAHNSPEEVGAALDADRSKNLKVNKTTDDPNLQINTGNQIESSSNDNKELKKSTNDRPATTVINNNTSTQQNTTNKSKPEKEDDRSAYQKKNQG